MNSPLITEPSSGKTTLTSALESAPQLTSPEPPHQARSSLISSVGTTASLCRTVSIQSAPTRLQPHLGITFPPAPLSLQGLLMQAPTPSSAPTESFWLSMAMAPPLPISTIRSQTHSPPAPPSLGLLMQDPTPSSAPTESFWLSMAIAPRPISK